MQINWNSNSAKEYLAQHIDFTSSNIRYQRSIVKKKELLFKALGEKSLEVFDLTAGLGEDSWLLARLGYKVTAFESNSFLYECLSQAHQKAICSEVFRDIAQRLTFKFGDSLKILELTVLGPHQALYMDPMFEFESQQTALPRKELQALRALLADEVHLDIQSSLDIIFDFKSWVRLVIKTPKNFKYSKYLPQFEVVGKAIRYSVFIRQGYKPDQK